MIHFNKYVTIFILLVIFAGTVFAANDSTSGRKPYSLEDCITEALNNHPKLGVYKQKIEQQKEKLRAVTAQNLPQVDAVTSYDRLSYVSQSKQRQLGGSNDDYQADIVATQPLFTGGKITSERKAARHSVDAAEQGYLAAREDVIFGVKAAYFKLLFEQEIMRSKEDLFKYAQISYNTALDLHERAKMPREETLLRLEVQLKEVRQDLITAQDSVKIAQKVLLNAMGLDSSNFIEVEDLPANFSVTKNMPVKVANNYEIVKLSKEVDEADEQIKIAKSEFYPQLNACYSYGYEWGKISEIEGKPEWVAGLTLDFNIWDWGKTKADVRQAKAYREELVSSKNFLNQRIGLELESARLKYESALSKLEIAEKSCEQAERSLDLFTQRYKDTLVTTIELLDAQRAFSETQINCAQTKLNLRLAKAEIEKIAGKGYEYK